jgi:uncharacterized protein YodC (DUF2158 family)
MNEGLKTSNIVAGDTVMLKSGGPPMTVSSISSACAECYYFTRGEELMNINIVPHMLKKVDV